MESMLNKLRSTMSSAASNAVSNAVSIASQVSNYLPGNPVTREYEATAHIASAGRGLMWKIYKGYKKSTKQEAAIFLFEKRQLEKWDRQERELMLDKLRKGVSQLTRLRHPQVLTVQHPLEESRETLAFATEPVHSSLANVLGKEENMPSPPPSYLKDFQFYDVEIKYGLMQISEGLHFLHNSVKIVHQCVNPENIVLNHQGAWKLFGFDFCVANQSSPDEAAFWPFEDHDSNAHELIQPPLDYLAPEYALTHKLTTSADMFSLGIVIYALYNKGKPLFQNHNDFAIFKSHANELKNPNKLSFDTIPTGLREQVRLMLNATAELRPDAIQFSKISFFDEIGVKTLNYLDQLFHWDNMQKSQFYKSLPQILPQLPHRVLLLRVIPCLVNECVNPTMVPFVLPVILQVAEKATKDEYIQHILPALKPIMKITEPIQVMLLLMMKMDLLLSKTPAEDVRIDTLPLLYRALECDTQQIQELCLSVIPTCAPLVDQPTMKNALLPRIKKLCFQTSYLSTRINCLVCIGKVLEYLDRWLVMDDIFPFLETVPSKEAPVVMATIGIFKMALYHKKLGISKETLATKVLPYLFPLSIENSLTPSQHSSVMSLIRDMIDRVETEHKAKLEHLNSIRNEQRTLEMNMPTSVTSSGSTTPGLAEDKKSDLDFDVFQSHSKTSPVKSADFSFASNLSLNEKQRLASQQNVQSSFAKQNQVPFLPSPPQPQNPINNNSSINPSSQISNSASNLINSNLNNLTLSKPNVTPMTTSAIPQLNGLNTSMNNVNNSSTANWPTNQQQGFTPNMNWNAPRQFSSNQVSQFSQQSFSSNLMSPQQQFPNMKMQPMSQFPNNAYNPMINSSFGSMGSPLQPSSNNSQKSPNSGFKPLSSSDINDLLS